MKKCDKLKCEKDACFKIVSNKYYDIVGYCCEDHKEEVFDMIEDLEIARIIEEALANDNGVRYTLDDLIKRNKERSGDMNA